MYSLLLEEREKNESLMNKLVILERSVSKTTNELEDLKQSYLELENQYQAILNSKRWRIATRIANLFRRK